jgi:hypothetical protein
VISRRNFLAGGAADYDTQDGGLKRLAPAAWNATAGEPRMLTTRWHLLHSGMVMALAITSAVLFAPGQAQAGCGEYVVIGPRGNFAGMSATPTHPPMTPRADETGPGGPRPPCSGPLCSQSPQSPPVPATPPPAGPVTEWGDIGPTSFALDPLAVSPLPDEGSERPERCGAAVFHPPR